MALIDNLVLYHKHEDNLGNTNVINEEGTDSTASTNTNNLNSVNGIIDDSFDFTSASSEKVTTTIDFSDYSTWSVSLWFRWDASATGYPTLIGQDISSGDRVMYINYLSSETSGSRFVVMTNDGTTTRAVFGSDIPTDTWTHIVITVDTGTTNAVKLYINGALDATGDGGSGGTSAGTALIGWKAYAGNYYEGNMDEIGFWDKVLTSDEVTELWNGGAGLAYPFSVATTRLIKIAGSFVAKPILTKVGGTFVDKPIKIKVGGTFQDA